jgi:hypothetical protein
MSSVTVRINEECREILRQLSTSSGESMQAVLERAVEQYRRRVFFEQTNAEYARLRKDRAAWAEIEKEREEWDAALGDGLE